MNNKFDFMGAVPHDYVTYRQKPRTYALWEVNGEWITSTKTNYEVYKIAKKLAHDAARRVAKANGEIPPKSLRNKTDTITYVEALSAGKMFEGGKGYYQLSKIFNADYRAIKRAIALAAKFGKEGFYRYG